MSTHTTHLNLFEYNTSTDGSQVFSIDTALNENFEKIDNFAGQMKDLSDSVLSAAGRKRFSDINTELGKKLEAEVLLAENGYIKFNNGIYVQWGNNSFAKNTDSMTLNFPVTFRTKPTCVNPTKSGMANRYTCAGDRTVSWVNISLSQTYASNPIYFTWIAIGY